MFNFPVENKVVITRTLKLPCGDANLCELLTMLDDLDDGEIKLNDEKLKGWLIEQNIARQGVFSGRGIVKGRNFCRFYKYVEDLVNEEQHVQPELT